MPKSFEGGIKQEDKTFWEKAGEAFDELENEERDYLEIAFKDLALLGYQQDTGQFLPIKLPPKRELEHYIKVGRNARYELLKKISRDDQEKIKEKFFFLCEGKGVSEGQARRFLQSKFDWTIDDYVADGV